MTSIHLARSAAVRVSQHIPQIPTHLGDRAHWTAMCGRLWLHNGGKLQRSLPQIMFLDRLYTPRQVVAIIYDLPKNALQRAVDGTWSTCCHWWSARRFRGLVIFVFFICGRWVLVVRASIRYLPRKINTLSTSEGWAGPPPRLALVPDDHFC